MFILLYILLLIIGIAVGAITGITGSSGVVVVVPVLSYMGINFKTDIGTSLLVDVITTTIVIYVYLKKKTLHVIMGLLLGAGALVGAQIGANIADIVPVFPLEIVFTIMMAYMAYYTINKSYHMNKVMKHIKLNSNFALFVGFLLAIPVGILTGIIGASGGVLFIFIIILLFTMDAQNMVGTATLAMFISASSGAFGYYRIGHIYYVAAILIGIVALGSGYYFSILAHKLDQKYIYRFLGVIFVLVVVSELFRIAVLR